VNRFFEIINQFFDFISTFFDGSFNLFGFGQNRQQDPAVESTGDDTPSGTADSVNNLQQAFTNAQQLAVSSAPEAPFDVTINSDGKFDSDRALYLSRRDNARAGYCAKGVANILIDQGYPVQRANAKYWDENLQNDPRWVRLDGVSPEDAPEGAVLCFDSDPELGKRLRRNGGGSKYGHVEVVAKNSDGENIYISDAARTKFGGSVPENYVGAYVFDPHGAIRTQIAQARNRSEDTESMMASVPLSARDSEIGLESVEKIETVFNAMVAAVRSTTPAGFSSLTPEIELNPNHPSGQSRLEQPTFA
jgi:surface antigen